MHTQNETITEVAIIGAGPAGCAAALALKNAGLQTLLIDKSSFPRDKVCGDAIPGRAVKVLRSIDPGFAMLLKQYPHACETKKAVAWYNGRTITFNWNLDAYTCSRLQFDNLLLSLVGRHTRTTILTGKGITNVESDDGYNLLTLDDGTKVKAQIIIGADGAQSVVAKQLAGRTMDRNHHVGSVRTYFSGLSGMASNTVEVYFDKKFSPGYLWLFPLPNGIANVGFGMLSAEIAKRKLNLKKSFFEFIAHLPPLQARFKNAQQVSGLEGFGLPLGSRSVPISGNRFMLAGDAASLIDPITGDGIGNAMLSGKLAAEQAVKCFSENNFSEDFMKQYDNSVKRALGKELKDHYNARRILTAMPFLLDVTFAAGRSRVVQKLISRNF